MDVRVITHNATQRFMSLGLELTHRNVLVSVITIESPISQSTQSHH